MIQPVQMGVLLTYSRIATRVKPFSPIDLAQVAQDAASDLELAIEDTGAQVEMAMPTLEAEPDQMRQLFQNLIGNALKYHREDEKPRVRIHGVLDNSVGRIFVEDNGIGFDEKYLDRIFKPLQRLHGRDAYEGVGMGLEICRRIVERHGGSLTAESKPGEGTTFIITLPLKQPSKIPRQSIPKGRTAWRRSGNGFEGIGEDCGKEDARTHVARLVPGAGCF